MKTFGMHRHNGLRLLVAGLISAVTLAAAPNTALAAEQAPNEAVATLVADAVSAAGPAAGVAKIAPWRASARGTLVGPVIAPSDPVGLHKDGAATELSVPVVPGEAPISVTLPTAGEPALAANGTAILEGATSSVDFAVQALDNGGARVQAVLNESAAPNRIPFSLDLPTGATLRPLPDGGAIVVGPDPDAVPKPAPDDPVTLPGPGTEEPAPTADGTAILNGATDSVDLEVEALDPPPADVADDDPSEYAGDETTAAGTVIGAGEAALLYIPEPWAIDAEGSPLATQYEVVGNTLTQIVDTRGAKFPVVADPVWIPVIIALTAAASRMAAPALARAFSVVKITPGMKPTTRGGFKSFDIFKRRYGKRADFQWHHIVENKYGLTRWRDEVIQNPRNLVQIPKHIHQKCINSKMGTIGASIPGHIVAGPHNTLRQAINNINNSYEKIHTLGIALLRLCGVKI